MIAAIAIVIFAASFAAGIAAAVACGGPVRESAAVESFVVGTAWVSLACVPVAAAAYVFGV